MQTLSQNANTSMLIAEAGLILAILAIISAIAVARRADSMYRETSQGQATTNPPPAK